MPSPHSAEVAAGIRFAFGENWSRFLRGVTEDRIRTAERSLADMLGVTTLQRKRCVHIVSGSELFSVAARRLARDSAFGRLRCALGGVRRGTQVPRLLRRSAPDH